MDRQALAAGRLFDLTGKTAIVTGASSGLGVMFANTLAVNGANVVLAARRRDRLEAVAGDLPGPGGSVVVECDITQPDQVDAMCDVAVDEFGSLDVLVANAGVVAEGMPAIERTPPELFAMGIDVNVNGTFYSMAAAGRRMLVAGSGSIIVNASIAGMSGHRGFPSAYCAAKAAVIQLTQQLAATWADRGVRVNAIAPGFFPSEMTEGFLAHPGFLRRCEEMSPSGRIGDPAELAGPLLLLASDAGSYINGAILPVDGGMSCTMGSSPYADDLGEFLQTLMPDDLGVPITPA